MNNTNVMNHTNLIKFLFTGFFLLAFAGFIAAQSAYPSGLLASNDWASKGIDKDDLSFFYDADNQAYYIDFETISLNLTIIKVKDRTNNIIISDEVADLPVNTIYELDCSHLKNGDYTIELHSYTKVLRKKVSISTN